jgi:hypothetical protein
MKTYELQVLDKGSWQTDSVYDQRGLAETQAKQMDGNSRYAGIRVIEEVFHEGSDKSVCTTVYRDAGHRQESEDRIQKSRQAIRTQAPASNKEVTRVPRKKVPQRNTGSNLAGLYWGLGIAAVIAATGGGAFMLL